MALRLAAFTHPLLRLGRIARAACAAKSHMPSDAAPLDSFDRQILAIYQCNTRLPGEQIGAQQIMGEAVGRRAAAEGASSTNSHTGRPEVPCAACQLEARHSHLGGATTG